MSRGQGTTPPGRAPQWRHPDADPRLVDPRQTRQPAQSAYPNLPPIPPQPAAQAFDAYGRPIDPEPQYHYPQPGQQPQQQPSQQGYAPRQPAYPPAPEQPYAPQLSAQDAYQQQLARFAQDPMRGADYPPEPSLQSPPPRTPQQYRQQPPPPPVHDPRLDLRGSQYDQGWQQAQQRPADPNGYDLGGYSAGPQGGAYPPAGGNALQPGDYDDNWNEPQPPPISSRDQRTTAVQPVHEDEYEDEEEYEEEETTGGWRRWLVMIALVVSIGAGGAIAYVYKKYMSGSQVAAGAAVVRASKEPQKVAPDNAGGRQFAGSDSRYLGRLESDSAQAADIDSNGVRRVQTLQVARDGSLAAPAIPVPPPAPPSQTPNANGSLTIPGAIIEGFGRPPGGRPGGMSAPLPPPTPAPQPPTRVAIATPPPAPPAPSRPQVLSRATAEPADPQAIQPAAAPKAKAPAQPVPKTPPATSASASAGGASGYVCVLASTASRMEALKKFADLQQKFDVLKDHVPEVKEVDLSARGLGTMYRLVAGPPSSREAASGLCSNLRTSGLAGDPWVTTY